jgi:hypothetical protein
MYHILIFYHIVMFMDDGQENTDFWLLYQIP